MENLQWGNMKRKRFYSIDIMKMIFACLVVGIHAQLLNDFCKPLGELITSSFGRMAVPFFSCVTGYFFIQAEQNGKRIFGHQIISLLKYYLIFSLIYIVWDFINGSFSGMGVPEIITTIIKRFLFYGTYYHLWFFPCIIFSILVIHLGIKWHRLKLFAVVSFAAYLFTAFTYGWNQIGQAIIPGLSRLLEWFDFDYIRRFVGVTLPFALLGAVILRTNTLWIEGKRDRLLWIAWIGSLVINVAEVEIALKTGNADGTTVTFTLILAIYFTFILGLRYPMEKLEQAGTFGRRTSILLYGLHPLILEAMEKIVPKYFSETIMWGISIILCIFVSWILEILRKEDKYDFKKRSVV